MSKFLFYLLTLLFVLFISLPIINKDAILPLTLKPEDVAKFLSEMVYYWIKVFQALKFNG